jgi:hypothetical protein
MEDNRDLKGLIMALKDDDVFVRRNATKAIGRLGIKYNAENINTYSIRIALHDALNDKDHLVKKYANNTLLAPSFNREHSNSANALPAGKLVSETSNNIKEKLEDKKPSWFSKQSGLKKFFLMTGAGVLILSLLLGLFVILSVSNHPTATQDNISISNNSNNVPSNLTTSTDTNSINSSTTTQNTQSNPPSTTADAYEGYKLGYSYGYDDGSTGEQYWDTLTSSISVSGAYREGYKNGYNHGYNDGKNGKSPQEL